MNANGGCTNRLTFDRVNATFEALAYNHLSMLAALNQGDYVEVCAEQTSGVSIHYVSPKP